jgi:hypothetical protein
MGFVSDVVGGVADVFGARNKFKPGEGTNPEQVKQVFGQGQDVYGQQQSLAQALQQQEALKAQTDILGALQATANGQGPNPALEQLKQTTGQNIQQATGMIASQKGINPALAARYALGSGAGANQQAAGQAATLAAQQQLAARGQAGDLASQMAQQRINQMQGMGGQNLQQQGILQGALAGQNQINAQVAQQNAAFGQQMLGGAIKGASAAFGAGGMGAAGGAGGSMPFLDNAMAQVGSNPTAAQINPYSFAQGGTIPEPASYLGKRMAGLNMKGGGPIPGQAQISGDSTRNDTVPIMASPGEIMLPRTVAQADNAPEAAAEFVAALKERSGGGKREMAEGGLVEAFKNWMSSKEEDSAEAGKGVAEEVSKKLPEAVMPRGAIQSQRERLRKMDEQTKD